MVSTTTKNPETTRSGTARTRTTATVAGAVTVAFLVALLPGSATASTDSTSPEEADPKTTSSAEPARSVRLRVGAEPVTRVSTTAKRPRQLLREQRVRLREADRIRLRRAGATVTGERVLSRGDLVRVDRITRRERTRRIPVPRPIVRRGVTTLPPGRKKVVRPGRRGIRVVEVVRVRQNGEFSHRRVTSSTKVREPRARRVLVGRAYPTVPGTGHLNWRALAQCESSGNPRAVNAAGYYGLYQFDTTTWRSVGGTGMPHQASRREQTRRAQRLYGSRGRSPWPNCGRLL